MNSSNPKPRRRAEAKPSAEALETRSLLTGGGGNTFALLPATIAQAGGSIVLPFAIDPASFTLPHGRVVLGVDAATPNGSTIKPDIKAIVSQSGAVTSQASRPAAQRTL